MKILIDPGHGGPFTGAVSHGVRECDINLAVAIKMRKYLQRPGVEAWLTRDGDYALSEYNRFDDISKRARMAGDSKADLLVSLHCNNYHTPVAHGMEIWTTVGQNNSDIVAEFIGLSMMAAFPNHKMRTDTQDGDLDREKDFNLIKDAPCRAVLVEMGFLSNDRERGWLQDQSVQQKMAVAIADGVLDWRVDRLT